MSSNGEYSVFYQILKGSYLAYILYGAIGFSLSKYHRKALNPGNRSSEGGCKMMDLSEFTRYVVYLEVALPLGAGGHGSNPSSTTSACGLGQATFSH